MKNNDLKESVSQNTENVCGPGCDCHAPSSDNKMKIIVGLVIALVAVGIFIYKIFKTQPTQEITSTYTSAFNQNNINTVSPSTEQPKMSKVITNQVPKIKQSKE